MAKRKWTYWHKCIFAHESCNSTKVGDIIGMDEITKEWYGHDDKIKGFYVKARFELLGKLPHALHDTDPEEAHRRIGSGEWS